MAAFVSIDFVIASAEKHNCSIWRIYDSAGDQLDKQEKDSTGIKESLQQLREIYSSIEGDHVLIVISAKVLKRGGDQITNVYRYKVRCLNQDIASPAMVPAKQQQLQPVQYGGDITAQLIALNVLIAENKKDLQIRDLQQQLKDAQDKPGKKQLLEKYLEKIFLESEKKAAPVAGIKQKAVPVQQQQKQQPVIAGTAEDKKKTVQALSAALKELGEVDADLIASVQKLAKFAKENPDQYKSYLQML